MRPFFRSLRFKIVLSVIIPVLLALVLLSWSHYVRQQNALRSQLHQTATQVSDLMFGSLHHAMQVNDFSLASHILADVSDLEHIDRVQLLDMDGIVVLDSQSQSQGERRQTTEPGCIECHAFPAGQIPRSIELSTPVNVLRIETPVFKMPECMQCHAEQKPFLGILLMDVSLNAIQQDLRTSLQTTLLVISAAVFFVASGIYLIMDWLVVRRVVSFHEPMLALAGRDFSARMSINDRFDDEITDLGLGLNAMADQLSQQARQQEELSQVRQQAILEERERIARELHDGFAQIPAYVQTKAGAVRLMLENGQLDMAKNHLAQLEDAARELLVEVREAIISLRLSSQVGAGLKTSLQSYIAQLVQLSDIEVVLEFSPEFDRVEIDPETELQLFRIVQEALTNIRKHSGASRAKVALEVEDEHLKLVIWDDGKGFDQERTRPRGQSGFGIKNMVERAQAIGAEIQIDPFPEGGTCITVSVPMDKG